MLLARCGRTHLQSQKLRGRRRRLSNSWLTLAICQVARLACARWDSSKKIKIFPQTPTKTLLIKKCPRGWGFSSVVERLPRKRKALGLVPSSEKKNQKKKSVPFVFHYFVVSCRGLCSCCPLPLPSALCSLSVPTKLEAHIGTISLCTQ